MTGASAGILLPCLRTEDVTGVQNRAVSNQFRVQSVLCLATRPFTHQWWNDKMSGVPRTARRQSQPLCADAEDWIAKSISPALGCRAGYFGTLVRDLKPGEPDAPVVVAGLTRSLMTPESDCRYVGT